MNCRVAIDRVKCRKDTNLVKVFEEFGVFEHNDHWKVYLGNLKPFEDPQELEFMSVILVTILVYSKDLQFGLTPDDSREVETFVAVQSL